ncbi:MAG: transcriptional regulator [Denitrovibrio sp.]|nr:MAG: transcriptional regulator [Denitrovibrio sp.]
MTDNINITKICDILKAISNPIRMQILLMLSIKDCYTYELEEAFHLDRTTISRHLSSLKAENIIVATKEGQKTLYSIHITCVPKIIKCLSEYCEM